MEKCNRLNGLLDEQRRVIERHLDKHKWYNQIEDKNRAINDFIIKYGWLMREVFCDSCSDQIGCQAYQEYLKETGVDV